MNDFCWKGLFRCPIRNRLPRPPADTDLELSIYDQGGYHALVPGPTRRFRLARCERRRAHVAYADLLAPMEWRAQMIQAASVGGLFTSGIFQERQISRRASSVAIGAIVGRHADIGELTQMTHLRHGHAKGPDFPKLNVRYRTYASTPRP